MSMLKIPDSVKKLVSITNFRRLLVYTLITTCAFYFGSMSYANFAPENVKNIFQNNLLLKFIGISIIIHFIFYVLLDYILRLLFHGYMKDKILKQRNDLKKKGWFTYLKDIHGLYYALNIVFKDYVFRLGLLPRKDLKNINDGVVITNEMKEELLNILLADCYKSICIVIHFLFTLLFIWQYVKIWVVILGISTLLFLFILPVSVIMLIMNIELLNKVRLNILKSETI